MFFKICIYHFKHAHIFYISGVMTKCVSRWYNRTGWLGVKRQVTYLLTYSFSEDPIPQLFCSDATTVQISAEER